MNAVQHQKIKRSEGFVANAVELEYGRTPTQFVSDALHHDAWNVLHYAGGLLEVTALIRDWMGSMYEGCFGLGFLRGSADLSWVLRRFYPNELEGRFKLTDGLSDGGSGLARKKLGNLLRHNLASGMTRLFVIDEAISGTQLQTAARAVEDWCQEMELLKPLPVLLVGLRSAARSKDEREIRRLVRTANRKHKKSKTIIDLRLPIVPTLLALDNAGRYIRGIGRRVHNQFIEYHASRTFPGSYHITCKNSLSLDGCASLNVTDSDGSLDQTFGNAIWETYGGNVRVGRWPESILDHGCSDCREKLEAIRKFAALMPPSKLCQEGKILGNRIDIRNAARVLRSRMK